MVGNKVWLLVAVVVAAGLCWSGGGCGEKKEEAENHGFLEGGKTGSGGGTTVSPLGAEAIYVSNYGSGTVMKFAVDGAGSVYAKAHGAQGVAFDSKGNMYVSNWYQEEIWKITPEGQRSVFARTGMLYTYGLAVDRSDNVFVAIYQGNKIMKFAPDGTGSVFASDLNGPVALAFDQAGNLYVSNNSGHTIETFATDGSRRVFAEGLAGPSGLAFDRAGNLYVAIDSKDMIEKFSPTGKNLGVFAREGLHNPDGIAFDGAGNLYVVNWVQDPGSQEWSVMKFAPDGTASVFAKNGLNAPTFIAIRHESGATGAGPKTTAHHQVQPSGAGTTVGWWTFAGENGQAATGPIIERVHEMNGTPQGGPIYESVATAGGEVAGLRFNGRRQRVFVPDNPRLALTEAFTLEAFVKVNRLAPTQWNLNDIVFRGDNRPQLDPYFLAVDPTTGHLVFHIEDASRGSSDLVTPVAIPLGQLVHVAATYDHATGGQKIYLNRQLVASTRTNIQPFGALDPNMTPGLSFGDLQDGNFFVNHSLDGTLFEVRISNVALTPGRFLVGMNAPGPAGKVTASGFSEVTLLVSTWTTPTVVQINADGSRSNFANLGSGNPQGLVFDRAGNLYVSSFAPSVIQKITPGGVRSTFASAGLDDPEALVFDRAGNLYTANFQGNTVSRITPDGVCSIFASTGLNGPSGLAFDSAGNLYVSNYNCNTITRITPAGACSVFAQTGLDAPFGLAFDREGHLFVANHFSNTILKIKANGESSLFASGLDAPYGLAFDRAGNLYVANCDNNTPKGNIMKFTPEGVGSIFASNLIAPTFIAIRPPCAADK